MIQIHNTHLHSIPQIKVVCNRTGDSYRYLVMVFGKPACPECRQQLTSAGKHI